MSAIRPDLTAIATPPVAPTATRTAQAAFFRAALNGAAVPASPQMDRTPAPRAASPVSEPPADRIARPGGLLDIRV